MVDAGTPDSVSRMDIRRGRSGGRIHDRHPTGPMRAFDG